MAAVARGRLHCCVPARPHGRTDALLHTCSIAPFFPLSRYGEYYGEMHDFHELVGSHVLCAVYLTPQALQPRLLLVLSDKRALCAVATTAAIITQPHAAAQAAEAQRHLFLLQWVFGKGWRMPGAWWEGCSLVSMNLSS